MANYTQLKSRASDSSNAQGSIPMDVFTHPDDADETSDGIVHSASQGDPRSNGKRASTPANWDRRRRSRGTNQDNASKASNLQKVSKASTESSEETYSYTRPTGPEQVSPRHPSCSSLPPLWNHIHDRFIAYLATHAPLDRNGRVQKHEEKRERWKLEEIAALLGERFPRLLGEGGMMIKPSTVEKRLALLDQAGDNDYFKKQYGAYVDKEWGWGI